MNFRPLLLLIGTGTAGLISCGDKQISGPTDGTILVGAVTTGDDLDQNGYQFSVNNGSPTAIGLLDTVFVTALEAGAYEVRLSDISENCVPADGTNPQTTQVVAGDTVEVLFDVACEAVLPPPGDGGGNIRTTR